MNKNILSMLVLVQCVAWPLAAQASDDDAMALAKRSGCFACHSIENKIVGPAWKDVAARYSADDGARVMLIDKVKKGGKGSWIKLTGGVPMPPYSPRVSDENIETLVDFILGLNADG